MVAHMPPPWLNCRHNLECGSALAAPVVTVALGATVVVES